MESRVPRKWHARFGERDGANQSEQSGHRRRCLYSIRILVRALSNGVRQDGGTRTALCGAATSERAAGGPTARRVASRQQERPHVPLEERPEQCETPVGRRLCLQGNGGFRVRSRTQRAGAVGAERPLPSGDRGLIAPRLSAPRGRRPCSSRLGGGWRRGRPCRACRLRVCGEGPRCPTGRRSRISW